MRISPEFSPEVLAKTEKTPDKTLENSHWATDFFCRPFLCLSLRMEKLADSIH